MQKLWDQFEKWLKVHYPTGYKDLNPPASDKEIIELETLLDCSLPEDYVSCLKIHNGQGQNSAWLLNGMEFLSIERIEDEWEVWNELLNANDFANTKSLPDSGIKNCWWNKKWIPFTYNGAGDHFCLDMEPDSKSNGVKGQVIAMLHDNIKRELISPSFYKWFESYIAEVVLEEYAYSKEYSGIVKIN